jgi:hypothetical protein
MILAHSHSTRYIMSFRRLAAEHGPPVIPHRHRSGRRRSTTPPPEQAQQG